MSCHRNPPGKRSAIGTIKRAAHGLFSTYNSPEFLWQFLESNSPDFLHILFQRKWVKGCFWGPPGAESISKYLQKSQAGVNTSQPALQIDSLLAHVWVQENLIQTESGHLTASGPGRSSSSSSFFLNFWLHQVLIATCGFFFVGPTGFSLVEA